MWKTTCSHFTKEFPVEQSANLEWFYHKKKGQVHCRLRSKNMMFNDENIKCACYYVSHQDQYYRYVT